MTIEAITTFIFFEDNAGADQGRYQNSNTANTITFDSNPYAFLPFIYNGATKTLSGDNIESLLTFANNQLSLSKAYEAVESFWSVRVDTVLMDPSTFLPDRTLSTEYWIPSSISYNVAVTSSIPNKVLRSKDVGALPVTSRISNA